MRTKPLLYKIASLMALTAALEGCGGAATEATPPSASPPPTAPVALNFVQPVNNVLEPSGSDRLNVNVAVNGSTAPNGTVATFDVSPASAASFSPVSPTTVTGLANTTLTVGSLSPGATFQVRATTVSSTNTASDTVTYYVRPAHRDLELLVPAYFSTSGTPSPWTAFISGATSYPDVSITAIVNPSNGILTSTTTADASLSTAITNLKAVPGSGRRKVVGYIATSSSTGALTVTDIKNTISNYLRLYPAQLDGFFLEGMSTDSTRAAYFQEIYDHIHSLTVSAGISSSTNPPLVIGNPGTYPAPVYAAAADTLVTYTGNAAAYQTLDPQPSNAWVYAKANTAQAMMVHTASSCTEMQNAVKSAARPRMNTGMVYVTNLTIGAAWSALPSYWQQLLGTVDATNKSSSLPLC